MALLDGSALSALNRGLFTGLAYGQRNRQSNAINRYRLAQAESFELANEEEKEKQENNIIFENPEIHNLIAKQVRTDTATKLGQIQTEDIQFTDRDNERLISADTLNNLFIPRILKELKLPEGSAGKLRAAKEIYGGTMPVPEDSFVLEVTNPDGSMGVLTRNASNADNAEVVFKSKKEIMNHVNGIYDRAKAKSDLYPILANNEITGRIKDLASQLSFRNSMEANNNAANLRKFFTEFSGYKEPRTPETEERITNRTAFSLFKEDVLNKLKLLTPDLHREIFDKVEQTDTPLDEYQALTIIATELNKINTTDISQAGETLKIKIPKIDSSFFKELETFNPVGDQEDSQPQVNQPQANNYQELIEQIVNDRLANPDAEKFPERIDPKDTKSRSLRSELQTSEIDPRRAARQLPSRTFFRDKNRIRKQVAADLNKQVQNIRKSEGLNLNDARQKVVDTFGISSQDPMDQKSITSFTANIFNSNDTIEEKQAKAEAAASNPNTRNDFIAANQKFLIDNGLTSRAAIQNFINGTSIGGRPDLRIIDGLISAYSALAVVDPTNALDYRKSIQNLAETGSFTQTRDQQEKNILKERELLLERDRLNQRLLQDRNEKLKLQDPSDLISQTGASIRRAIALEEDDNLTAEAEVEAFNNLDLLLNRMFDDTGQGFRRKSNIKVADQNKFYNLVLLELARRAVRDKEDLFPAIFKSRTLGRGLKTGLEVLRGDVDFSRRIGVDLKRKIVIEDGELAFLDSNNNLTEQKLTREQVGTELSEQLANLVFDLAQANTTRIINRRKNL